MWLKAIILSLFVALVSCQTASPLQPKVVCYYNSTSFLREGLGKLVINDLEPALPSCTHVVYGWATVDFATNKVVSSNPSLDLEERGGKGNFRLITALKRRYSFVKFLLGIGGLEYNKERTKKYHEVLENSGARLSIINSAYDIVETYGFDGVNIAWEFPPVKPKKIRSTIGSVWHGLTSGLSSKIVDEKADEHKEEYTAFTHDFKNAFKLTNYIITATVLPNVNASHYYDVPAIMNDMDFVVLSAFDFNTPERNPKEADFAAPLYSLGERSPEFNADSQISYWLGQGAPATKVILGIPTYGLTWKLDSNSGLEGEPPISAVGAAEAGPQTQHNGKLSWPEVCNKLPNARNAVWEGKDGPLRKVPDPTKRYGPYAYRLAEGNNDGEWVSYEEPASVVNKAQYVKAKRLGGIGIFDLSLDDFRGQCQGEKYPILRAAKQAL